MVLSWTKQVQSLGLRINDMHYMRNTCGCMTKLISVGVKWTCYNDFPATLHTTTWGTGGDKLRDW